MCFAIYETHRCGNCHRVLNRTGEPVRYEACRSSRKFGDGVIGNCVEGGTQPLYEKIDDHLCRRCEGSEGKKRKGSMCIVS